LQRHQQLALRLSHECRCRVACADVGARCPFRIVAWCVAWCVWLGARIMVCCCITIATGFGATFCQVQHRPRIMSRAPYFWSTIMSCRPTVHQLCELDV
jgi:hypothetical protein